VEKIIQGEFEENSTLRIPREKTSAS
jgi:hypothetical protein